jgi:hypothetical protein
MAHMTAMITHPGGSGSASGVTVMGLLLNGYNNTSFVADSCLTEHGDGPSTYIVDIVCINTDYIDDNGNSNIPIDLGTATTGNGDMVVSNILAGGSSLGSQQTGNDPQIKAVVTAGAISGFIVGNSIYSDTITAPGSGGTPGTYNWTSTGTVGTNACDQYPFGTYTIGSGGTLTAFNYQPQVGLFCQSTPPTIVWATGTGLTGQAVTLTMNTGAAKIGVPFAGEPSIPVTLLYIGHALGQFPCTTMPTVYAAGTPLAGQLTNPPVIAYDGNGRLVSVTLADSTLASTGAGCSTNKPIRVKLYAGSTINNVITMSFPDSIVSFVRATAGLNAGIQVWGGGSFFNRMHAYDTPRYLYDQEGGNNYYTETECDSPSDACFLINNGSNHFAFTTVAFDTKEFYQGAAEYVMTNTAGSRQSWIGGQSDGLPLDGTDYNSFVCATGPVSTGVCNLPIGEMTDLTSQYETGSTQQALNFSRPITGGPTTNLRFQPFLETNSTTTSRNLLLSMCGFKYINSSVPVGCYPWTMEVYSGPYANQLEFFAPGTDPQLQSNSVPPEVVFGTSQLPYAGQNYNSPLFAFKGNGCYSVISGVCTSTSPQVGMQEVLNPSTVGGAITSVTVLWTHSTNTYPHQMVMPYNFQPNGVYTPGVTVAPLPYPTITVITSPTGGTLAAGTYCYSASSVSVYGETVPSPQQCVTTTGSTSTVSVLQSNGIATASYYNVYGRTSGSQLLMTPTGVSITASTLLFDNGSITPSGVAQTSDHSMAPTSYQPVASTPFIYTNATTAEGGTGQLVYGTGSATAQYHLKGSVACDAASSGSQVVLTVLYIDPSSTAQTATATAVCTTLGAASVAQINQVVRVRNATGITAHTTITGTPTYDTSMVVVQDTQF